MSDHLVGPILAALVDALRPLDSALADPLRFQMLVRSLDEEATFDDPTLGGALDPGGGLTDLVGAVTGAIEAADIAIVALGQGDPTAVPELIARTGELLDAISDLPGALDQLGLDTMGVPPEMQDPQWWVDRLADLPERLLLDYLDGYQPLLSELLVALDVITVPPVGPSRLHLDRLGQAITDPAATVEGLAGWGSAQLDDRWVTGVISDVVSAVGLPARVVPLRPELVDRFDPPVPGAEAVEVPVVAGFAADGSIAVEVGLVVGVGAGRLLVTNLAWGEATASADLGGGWDLRIDGELDQTGVAGVLLGVDGVTDAGRPGNLGRALVLTGRPATRWRPLGTASSTRLEIGQVEIAADLSAAPDPQVELRAAVADAELVLVAADLGSLVEALTGGAQARIPFGVDLAWSTRTGFTVGGGAGLSFSLPFTLELGPLTLTGLAVGAASEPDGALSIEATVDADVVIGPLSGGADGIGISARILAAPDGRGTLGPVDVELAVVPPTTIRLAIEAPLTTGGGVIHLDPDNGVYAGALAVDIAGVGISAFVSVTAGRPELPGGWALFATLGARFPSVPLVFGFTLNGVGGLLAVNRTMDADALAASLRSGTADALLFPDDPENDGMLLLDQLDDLFPISAGSTVVGPVVEIGWGAPNLITAQIGVVVVVPDGIIAVLGSVEAIVPSPDAPLLELHLDTLGVIDIPAGAVTVTASLYDSHLLETIHLSGDMAAHVEVGSQPWFMLSVGGFHPGFHPPCHTPATFYGLRRMSASVPLGLLVDVTVEAYFAITSNTLQFGSLAHIEASFDFLLVTYTARGWFGFDVLLTFNPFSFAASMSAGVSISAGNKELFGVRLNGVLEGPKPWFVSGRASFSFFGIDVPFEVEFGDRDRELDCYELFRVVPEVVAALEHPEAWEPIGVGGDTEAAVTLAPTEAESEDDPAVLVLRPDNGLTVRQSVVPLERDIDVVGHLSPSVGRVGIVAVGTTVAEVDEALGGWELIDDWFAPAHYDRLGSTDRLNQPSYELMSAGVSVTNERVAMPGDLDQAATIAPDGYDEALWTDDDRIDLGFTDRWTTDGLLFAQQPETVDAPSFEVAGTGYTLARVVDGRPATQVLAAGGGNPGRPLDYTTAVRLLDARQATTGERGRLMVTPASAAIASGRSPS